MWRLLAVFVLVASCGGGGDPPVTSGEDARSDSPPAHCQPIPAMGQFVRRPGNPRIAAGRTFFDAKLDTSISDPDVRFDATAGRYELYYGAEHATTFSDVDKPRVIRHASSVDRVTWTIDDAPVFAASPDLAAWDHVRVDAPTVAFNPDAPAERRYLLLYAGASRTFPHPGYSFPDYSIGGAFSADGKNFVRVAAADSPHGQAGLVITGAQTYPAAGGAIVGDPDVAYVAGVYHVFVSSFACDGANCAHPVGLGVAHASSADGITWTVLEAPVRSLLRTSSDATTGGQQPSVVYDAEHCRWELWQTSDLANENDNQPVELDNMVGVWRAESTDGQQWSIFYAGQRELAWNQAAPAPGEKLGLRSGVDVAQNSTGRLMLYGGFDDQNVPPGFSLPDRTALGSRAGVMTLNIATRDLP